MPIHRALISKIEFDNAMKVNILYGGSINRLLTVGMKEAFEWRDVKNANIYDTT